MVPISLASRQSAYDSGPTRDCFRVAINQDSQRRRRAQLIAVDLGYDPRCIRTGSRPQGFQGRRWQVSQRLWRFVSMELEGVDARLLDDLQSSRMVGHRRTRRLQAQFARAPHRERR